MFQIGKTIVGEDIIEKDFVCNLSTCKGECCIAGEAGAPLDEKEILILKEIYPKLKPFLREEETNSITASVFPLAFPLIAGPGSLTTLLSLRAEFATENIIVAILANMVFLYIILKTSSHIERAIGANGINIIRKIFGVILLAIAVKLFTANIKLLLT